MSIITRFSFHDTNGVFFNSWNPNKESDHFNLVFPIDKSLKIGIRNNANINTFEDFV